MSGTGVGFPPAWSWGLLLVGCGQCRITVPDTDPPVDSDSVVDTAPVDTGDSAPSHVDADGDGYTDYYDCDDGDPEIHPAAEELCDDVDNDCDGSIDEGRACSLAIELAPSDAYATFFGAAPGDQAGEHMAGVGDVDGDGYHDLLLPSFANDSAGEDAGAAYLFLGPVSGDHILDTAYAWFLGEAAGDQAGRTVGSAGDQNDDGYPDLLIGAPAADNSAPSAGTIYVVYGPHDEGEHSLADADGRIFGQSEGDWLGDAELLGDMNHDGFDDLIVASQYDKTVGEDAGVAYVVLGPVSGDQTLSDHSVRITGAESGDQAGSTACAAGDVNGDGFPDLLVGARFSDVGGRDSGAVYLLYGPVTDSISLADADFTIQGDGPDSLLGAGWSVSSAADHDGDGRGDFLVGARGDDNGVGPNAGAAWLILAGDLRDLDYLAEASASFYGEAVGDLAGTSVSGVSDMDGDDRPEVAIGASLGQGADSPNTGAAYVFYGLALGSFSLSDADLIMRGGATDDMAGWSIENAGDVAGDGSGFLLMGALASDTLGLDAGAIYLFAAPEEE